MIDQDPDFHYLVIGDGRDVPAIAGMLTRLPDTAYGQVFIEVEATVQVRHLDAPEGLVVTWLVRAGTDAPEGGLAVRAGTGWVEEWLPEDSTGHHAHYALWIGCCANDAMDELCRVIGARLGDVHIHHGH